MQLLRRSNGIQFCNAMQQPPWKQVVKPSLDNALRSKGRHCFVPVQRILMLGLEPSATLPGEHRFVFSVVQ